jgi:hypothetical protein
LDPKSAVQRSPRSSQIRTLVNASSSLAKPPSGPSLFDGSCRHDRMPPAHLSRSLPSIGASNATRSRKALGIRWLPRSRCGTSMSRTKRIIETHDVPVSAGDAASGSRNERGSARLRPSSLRSLWFGRWQCFVRDAHQLAPLLTVFATLAINEEVRLGAAIRRRLLKVAGGRASSLASDGFMNS